MWRLRKIENIRERVRETERRDKERSVSMGSREEKLLKLYINRS